MQKNEKTTILQKAVVVAINPSQKKPEQCKEEVQNLDIGIKEATDIKKDEGIKLDASKEALKEQLMAKLKLDNENKKLRRLRFKMEITSQKNTKEMKEVF